MQAKALFSAVSIALGTSFAGSLTAATADFCDTRVTDREPRLVETMAKPGYLESYHDPAFGSEITRISNAKQGGVVKTMYNTVQAWNADESKLILYHTGTEGPGHHLYDGQTYDHIRKLDIVPADLEEVFWDPKSADHLYYVQAYPVNDEFYDTLVRYNVNTEEKQIVADVGQLCGHPEAAGGSATSGSDVQAMYGDHIGLRCNNNAFNGDATDQTFIVNVRTGEISNQVVIDPAQPFAGNDFGYAYNVSMSPTPSNQRVLLQGSVLDTDMNLLRNLDISYNGLFDNDGVLRTIPNPEHNSIGLLPNGHDAMYTAMYDPAENGCDGDANGGTGSMVSYDLETGACRVIIGQSNGWAYPQSGTHVSALSSANPGWVVMSTIGYGNYKYFSNNRPAPVLFSEISLTYADEDEPKTCRLAHTRTYAKDAENTSGYGPGYFGEPHPVLSPSGTRILFASDWYDSGSVDTYVIDLRVPASDVASGGEDGSDNGTDDSGSGEGEDSGEENPGNGQGNPGKGEGNNDNGNSEGGQGNSGNGGGNSGNGKDDSGNDQGDSEATSGEISVSKPVYTSGERVTVHFADASGAGDDWVSIAPVGSPDGQLLMWLYTNGTQTVSAEGPLEGELQFLSEYIGIGDFEARLFLEGAGVASQTVRFTITEEALPEARLSVSQEVYSAGDTVQVNFTDTGGTGSDWISIAPVGSSDAELLMWLYTNGTQSTSEASPVSGSVEFLSDYIGIGRFEARLFLEGSDEVTHRIQFEISADVAASVTTSKAVYAPGDEVLVNFDGAIGSGRDWVGIAPVGAPNEQVLMWLYTNGSQQPSDAGPVAGQLGFLSEYIGIGDFEARLFFDESYDLQASVRFSIQESAVEENAPTVSLSQD
ncbi:MAG: hypothetical protein KDJ38_10110, partial [Gammaproteobacteria bacterium]|nr:hypothetical protein [Gammaproteobacteria bacterium]